MKRMYKGWEIQRVGITWTAKKDGVFLDHFTYLKRIKKHIDFLENGPYKPL